MCYENVVAHPFSTNGSYMELFINFASYCETMFISALALWLVFLNDCNS